MIEEVHLVLRLLLNQIFNFYPAFLVFTYLPEEKTIYIYISIPSVIPNSSLVEWLI